MIKYYGTYLNFLVLETIQSAARPLSVKEIARAIFVYPTDRENRNFQDRIRRAVRFLLDEQLVTAHEYPSAVKNLSLTKYQANEGIATAEESGQRTQSA